MYIYLKSEPTLWTTGFFDTDGKWHPDADYSNESDAAERVHYLNGGKIIVDNIPTTVYRSTHDLLRGNLMLLLQEHRREEITPEELNNFLLDVYKELNLKLEV